MSSPYPLFIFQRVGLSEDQKVLIPVVVVSLVPMALALLLWPVAALAGRHYQRSLELTPQQRRIRIGVKVVLALDILFVAGIAGIVVYGLTHIAAFNDGLDKWIYLAQFIGVLGAVGTVVVLYDAINA